MQHQKCGHDDCSCAQEGHSQFCGPECRDQVTGNQPDAEGRQKMLSGQIYDKPECLCGHLDCENARPEPQL